MAQPSNKLPNQLIRSAIVNSFSAEPYSESRHLAHTHSRHVKFTIIFPSRNLHPERFIVSVRSGDNVWSSIIDLQRLISEATVFHVQPVCPKSQFAIWNRQNKPITDMLTHMPLRVESPSFSK